MSETRILVAGIGNIFLGDDAFGVEVAQKLLRLAWPPEVRIVDFGIRALDLTYALLDDCDAAILIDAVPRGEAPGTLFIIEPDAPTPIESGDEMAAGGLMLEAHSMDPVKVLRIVSALGGKVQRIFVVGCEPSSCGSAEEMQMEMSDPVRGAVDEAVEMVKLLVARIRTEGYNFVVNGQAICMGESNGHSHTSG